ncbi:hypothetical protein H8B02_34070 [Bradyrhizobium sp. Pear77]|uniref:hypothetical protein n=1 Tax=Bradyrhizobium altum TaxID=1571202 RepID=UPI001E2E7FB0|nr:hypothetical protein [Bradyrhizobium altum]MCC8958267.1 hypothetical protein [Bradyrhizobium altum]
MPTVAPESAAGPPACSLYAATGKIQLQHFGKGGNLIASHCDIALIFFSLSGISQVRAIILPAVFRSFLSPDRNGSA